MEDVKRTPWKCPAEWKDNTFLSKFKFKPHTKVMGRALPLDLKRHYPSPFEGKWKGKKRVEVREGERD